MGKPISIFGCSAGKCSTMGCHVHFCEHPALSPPSWKAIYFFDGELCGWAMPDYSAQLTRLAAGGLKTAAERSIEKERAAYHAILARYLEQLS